MVEKLMYIYMMINKKLHLLKINIMVTHVQGKAHSASARHGKVMDSMISRGN